MSLFRLPVNVVVVIVLLWSSEWPSQQVFLVLAGCQFTAVAAYLAFAALPEDAEQDQGYFPNVARMLRAPTSGSKALADKGGCETSKPTQTSAVISSASTVAPSPTVRRSPRLRKAAPTRATGYAVN